MKTDSDIKRDVEAELRWSPEIDETDIAVKVNGGVVALSGFARSYYDKYQAEATVKRVAGVAGVANDVEVRLPQGGETSDPETAREAVTAIKLALPVSHESIKVLVHKGRVTLEGTVEWQYLKEAAETAVRRLRGLTGVSNLITIRPRVSTTDIQHKIEDAFRRNAEVDAKHISIEARGSEVTLRGNVRSWGEREQAQRTAWSAPGVTQVKNQITVGP
ncbi:MAG: BON domain-containing protein [Acidobacteria bacterium]|nr:MAG: BON domain-containing protein [Acidobacteriota bacterium]